jgi:hypothetical protein
MLAVQGVSPHASVHRLCCVGAVLAHILLLTPQNSSTIVITLAADVLPTIPCNTLVNETITTIKVLLGLVEAVRKLKVLLQHLRSHPWVAPLSHALTAIFLHLFWTLGLTLSVVQCPSAGQQHHQCATGTCGCAVLNCAHFARERNLS